MAKSEKTPLSILAEAAGLYFSNLDKFIKYMSFPVLGQIAGLGVIFFITYFYTINLPKLLDKYPNLNDFWTLVGISVVITLPGFAIFCKAFWDYLVAYGAVNSMVSNMLKSGRVYDFDAHRELINRRALPFIGLWFLFGIFSLVALCPLMWVLCGIFAIYFVLVFQVFTFEPEQSPFGCVRRSLSLIKGHFGQTLMLMVFIGLLTYYIIPQIILTGLHYTGISTGLSNSILPFVKLFPEIHLEKYGVSAITHLHIAVLTVQIILTQILIQYTLPLRSILWSLWYKELNNGISTQDLPAKSSKKKNKTAKRPSEKLMEASKKKYSQKKLDDDIISRATEKDDDE